MPAHHTVRTSGGAQRLPDEPGFAAAARPARGQSITGIMLELRRGKLHIVECDETDFIARTR
jgi:hypothetical protein